MVQEYALDLVILAEARSKTEERMEQFKLAMISYDPKFIKVMYPEWAKKVEENKVEREVTEADLEDTTGEWKFTDQVSPEDAEAILQSFLTNPTGSFTGADLGAHDEEGWM